MVVRVLENSKTFEEALHKLATIIVDIRKVRARLPTNAAKNSQSEYPETIITAKKLLFEDAMLATD